VTKPKLQDMQSAVLKAFVEQREEFMQQLIKLRTSHHENAKSLRLTHSRGARIADGAAADCSDIIHAVEMGKPDFVLHVIGLGTGMKVQAFHAAAIALGLSKDEMREIVEKE
jgi:hypothetical protein